MNKPKRKGWDKAMKKLVRLSSRGARPRRLRRQSTRCMELKADYGRRLKAWEITRVKEADA